MAPGDIDNQSIRRLGWLKWHYTNWTESTALFDDQQCGWYIRLLMYAASQGNPPGYLEEDEDELKLIAGFATRSSPNALQDLTRELLDIATKWEVNGGAIDGANRVAIALALHSHLEKVTASSHKRWLKVRRKWFKSEDYPGLVYNPKLVETLKEAYDARDVLINAGKKGSQARWNKPREVVNLAEEMPSLVNSPAIDNPIGPVNSPVNGPPYGILDLRFKTEKTSLVKDTNESKDPPMVEEDSPDSQGLEDDKPQDGSKRRTRSKPKILFDENKFIVLEDMKVHLRRKHPTFQLFVDGDWSFIADKFKNFWYGQTMISWRRTFYTFATNQVVEYGYRPGKFNEGQSDETRIGPRSANAFESAAERNERLHKSNEEYTESLLSNGESDDSDDSDAIPLTSDDYGDT